MNDTEGPLFDSLRAVVDADAKAEAPPRVERIVMDAWDIVHAPAIVRRPRTWLRASAMTALAAATAVILAIVWRGPREPAPVLQHEQAAIPPGNGFIPLVVATDSTRIVQVLHVQLPRAALAGLGVTGGGEAGAGFVEAEILVGEDAVAHAIRLIQ
jgi:hypothetical protein